MAIPAPVSVWPVPAETAFAIPKSVTPSRIQENLDIFEFMLSPDDMQQIDQLNRNERTGSNPDEMHKK